MNAPFPYFGGKATIADTVWRRFGVVQNYVEPFAGSLAMLLANPNPPNIETVNDLDGYLVNFWRALQAEPATVARYTDYPVSEIDLHARHVWLVNKRDWLIEQMLTDPDFIAGDAVNMTKERVWFSQHCLQVIKQQALF